ncbi:hybrid non-ribosomal peptide synthetase/type I polyketide synthase [Kordia jejudonensis]|uniref:hybrid non-ribosomal peptide synthetase/type I polyketide synthase n=1 Tax=Kordia jejudonensis TaxID=1348245 RepID=UPI000AEE4AE7|nr:non-ribosomal peptide synthetase [Kordia jejudonensis]
MSKKTALTGMEIAVVGMHGKFPGAKNIAEFWENLCQGTENITFFSEEEAKQKTFHKGITTAENHVKAKGEIEDVDCFDARFFGYAAAEAKVMHPQTRLFHECCWAALENAGMNPENLKEKVGLFGGSSSSYEWRKELAKASATPFDEYANALLSDKDLMISRVAHKLNLKGPAIAVQTACSTSLVAIHLACRSLLMGECKSALAGGISVNLLNEGGYIHEEGMILSPDGHCRPFDNAASGTVFSDGVGVVVLKRLNDAIANNDTIHAVIKGSAINNDGHQKVGYTAPSYQGQKEVIKSALHMSRVAPESISYIETHGTGTFLGDPIEAKALTTVFKDQQEKTCALGFVKANIGHLDAAAGIAGMIKTILCLKHKSIPPHPNFKNLNPEIHFKNSPFFINDTLIHWKNEKFPLRAGVSSFGIGGTNVHIILEENLQEEKNNTTDKTQLLTFSAKTKEALQAQLNIHTEFFKKHPTVHLGNVAYTLSKKPQFKHRAVIIANNISDAIAQLEAENWITNDTNQDTLRDVSEENNKLKTHALVWCQGNDLDRKTIDLNQHYKLCELPSYPFAKTKFPLKIKQSSDAEKTVEKSTKSQEINDWFYTTEWTRATAPLKTKLENDRTQKWLIYYEESSFNAVLIQKIKEKNTTVLLVKKGTAYTKSDAHNYTISSTTPEHDRLVTDILSDGHKIDTILYLWNDFEHETNAFVNYIELLKTVTNKDAFAENAVVSSLSNNAFDVIGIETNIAPIKSTYSGLAKVINNEFASLQAKHIDIALVEHIETLNDANAYAEKILSEINSTATDALIAYRGKHRWIQKTSKLNLESTKETAIKIKEKGAYIITGGLGGVGLALASFLAKESKCTLVLTTRSAFPDKKNWEKEIHNENTPTKQKETIAKLLEIERLGAEIMISTVNIADEENMRQLFDTVKEKFSAINGIIHAAGIADGSLIRFKETEQVLNVLEAKVQGTLVIDKLIQKENLDFVILCSSLSSLLGEIGQAAYVAANAFMNHYAQSRQHTKTTRIISILWDRWLQTGMAQKTAAIYEEETSTDLIGVTATEGVAAFKEVLSLNIPTIAVSVTDLETRISSEAERLQSFLGETSKEEISEKLSQTQVQQGVSDIFEKILGERPQLNENFFELGGDSLNALRLLSMIQKQYKTELSLEVFMANSTVEAITTRIMTAQDSFRSSEIPSVEKSTQYTVSSAQKRIYVLQELDRTNVSYNMLQVVRASHMKIDRLQNAFQKLLERHEILRAYFVLDQGIPVMKIQDTVPFAIEEYSHDSGNLATIIQKFVRPFELNSPSLIRVGMLQNEQETILLVDMHHIISDGVSLNILIRDVMALYEDETLQPLTIQYKDITAWQLQKEYLESLDAQRNFWKEKKLETIAPLQLPIDKARKKKSTNGKIFQFELSKAQQQKLQEFTKKHAFTNFNVLLSTFYLLLSKLSNQKEIIVGTSVVGRSHPDMEKLVGLFANTIPLKATITATTTYIDFIKNVKLEADTCFENQELPFEELVADISHSWTADRNPLFDVMFDFKKQSNILKSDSSGLVIERITDFEAHQTTSKFDLSLTGFESDKGIRFNLEYATDLFLDTSIERYVAYFNEILALLIETPTSNIATAFQLNATESAFLQTYNATEKPEYLGKTVLDEFNKQVLRVPNEIAIVHGNSNISYKELDEKSNQLAHHLLNELQIQTGDVVATVADRSINLLIGILGILKAGAAFVPIDPTYPEERINLILQNANIQTVLTETSYFFEIAIAAEHVFALDAELDHIAQPITSPEIQITANQLAYIIHTSGTTGVPKGVMISHENLCNYALWGKETYLDETHVCFAFCTSIAFDLTMTSIFVPLVSGNTIEVYSDKETPAALMTTIIKDDRAHVIKLTPSHLKIISNYFQERGISNTNLKCMIVGGEAFSADSASKIHTLFNGNVTLYNEYGPTETTIGCSVQKFNNQTHTGVSVPIGKPVANTKIYLLNDTLTQVPLGVFGEIYVSGNSVGLGYYNNLEETQKRFINNPFEPNTTMYKTGDIAKFSADGELIYFGRNDEQVKIRGFRIETAEIEKELRTLYPQFQTVLVVAKEDSHGDQVLYAYYISDEKIKEKEIRDKLAARLPSYMIPNHCMHISEIPITSNGKVKFSELPNASNKQAEQHEQAISTTEIELTKIFADILDQNPETIGATSDFFDLGGQSLKAVTLSTRIYEVFNVDISLHEIFKQPNVRALAAHVDNAEHTIEKQPIVKVAPKDYYTTSNAQKRIFLELQLHQNSTMYNTALKIPLQNIDAKKLETAFNSLVEQQEALRTSFHIIDNEVVQKIHEKSSIPFQVKSLDSYDALQQMETTFLQPLQLENPELVRMVLVQLPENKSVLYFDIHHIISDAISAKLLIHNLLDLYHGKPIETADISYKDYAEWEASQIENQPISDFWKQQCNDAKPVNLPYDTNPKEASESLLGNEENFVLPIDKTAQLRHLCKSNKLTEATVLLGAFGILLSKISGQEDIIVATPFSERFQEETKNVVGIFIKTFPVRMFPKSEQSILEFFKEIQTEVWNILEHQKQAVDGTLNIPNDDFLYDILFAYQENEGLVTALQQNRLYDETQTIEAIFNEVKSKLICMIDDQNDTIQLKIAYRKELFLKETIIRLATYYQEIIELITKFEATKIEDIQLQNQLNEVNTELPNMDFDF